jgi:hypothetical protein
MARAKFSGLRGAKFKMVRNANVKQLNALSGNTMRTANARQLGKLSGTSGMGGK